MLLRRSRGDRSPSLQVRLFAFFALFALVLISAGVLLLNLAGVVGASTQRQIGWLDSEIEHVYNSVSEDFNKLSLRGVAFADGVSVGIGSWAQRNGFSETELPLNRGILEDLLAEQAGSLLATLDNNVCSGAFIILDAENPAGGDPRQRMGLYFKRTETSNLNAVSSKTYCLRGPAAIARTNGVELMGQWRMDFNVDGLYFYEKVLRAARENGGADLSRLYYWTDRFRLDGDSDYALLLVLPLISRNGAVYGLCGVEVSAMLFKRMYSPGNAEYPGVFTALTPARGGSLDAMAGLVAGNSYLTSRTTGFLTAESMREGVLTLHDGAGERYVGKTRQMRFYPADAAFADDAWALSLLMPASDWDSVIDRANTSFYGSLFAILAVGLLAAVFISRRYIRPVVSALELIKTEDAAVLRKTQIAEIDDLLEYLAEKDEELKSLGVEKESLSAELEQARLRASQRESYSAPVLDAYEQFLKSLETLTATERAVFNLYMKNYSAGQIAEELFVSINTVKFHNKNIYAKLGVSSLKELKVYVNMIRQAE